MGKTTLALNLLGKAHENYLNWDIDEHRENVLLGELPPSGMLIFDEIHKNRTWRRFLKGLFDLGLFFFSASDTGESYKIFNG